MGKPRKDKMSKSKKSKPTTKRKPKFSSEPQHELLKEFKQFHTVKIRVAFTELEGTVINFTKEGVVLRLKGEQEHKEYKAEEIQFIGDLGVN